MIHGNLDNRTIGLFDATGIGVGAIVGGGILALAGVAFATAGPAAIIAFALNGVIALLTALSFAEMASSFPESGGTYTFAKKVLSVRFAFMVGWIAWFASIMAGALYALGFASYASLALVTLWPGLPEILPGTSGIHRLNLLLAILPIFIYVAILTRRKAEVGQWANMGKMALFVLLILGGFWVLIGSPENTVSRAMTPFSPAGTLGILQAMGYTFITLQGFDLIAAVAGEVKQPERNIPRAMLFSLGAALAVYLPLLFVVATVGVAPGENIVDLSRQNPGGLLALAAENYLGRVGFWLVVGGALLAMLTALYANLFACSRMALTMARDRTLPDRFSIIHQERGSPVVAVFASGVPMLVLVALLSDVAAAGAAASLIFLLTFSLVHLTAVLARRRAGQRQPPFRLPLFPLIPGVGGLACILLALFQGMVVPEAGMIVLGWLVIGGLLYRTLFDRRAQVVDAGAEVMDPHLARLRGRNPLVLVPIANPASAKGLVTLANALAPPGGGRALMLSVVSPIQLKNGRYLDDFQKVLGEILASSVTTGVTPEALTTVAPLPREEISRVARLHQCESLLLGFGDVEATASIEKLELIMGMVDCDVSVLRAPSGWQPDNVQRILLPVGGHYDQSKLRARLLGSLCRQRDTTLTYLRVMPEATSPEEERRASLEVDKLARDEAPVTARTIIARDGDIAAQVEKHSKDYDLVILGLHQPKRQKRRFGHVALDIADRCSCPLILIGERSG